MSSNWSIKLWSWHETPNTLHCVEESLTDFYTAFLGGCLCVLKCFLWIKKNWVSGKQTYIDTNDSEERISEPLLKTKLFVLLWTKMTLYLGNFWVPGYKQCICDVDQVQTTTNCNSSWFQTVRALLQDVCKHLCILHKYKNKQVKWQVNHYE